MKSSSRIVLAALLMGAALPLPAFAATCTTLTIDLGSGSNDKNSAGQVTRLQVYLKELGHLSATPNGNFGPATFAAVKAFQAANGVSATGFVGPATRGVIKAKSCPVEAPAASAPDRSFGSFTSPVAGVTLAAGSMVRISWTATNGARSLVLEDEEGVARGFVTSNNREGSYSWVAGSVFSSATQKQEVVGSGVYRLRVIDESKGFQASDVRSGSFSIEAKGVSISSVFPSTVPNDGRTGLVIYGDGFTTSTAVFLDGQQSDQLKVRYVSDDGKIMVLNVPERVSTGVRRLSVKTGKNIYSGGQEITIVSR